MNVDTGVNVEGAMGVYNGSVVFVWGRLRGSNRISSKLLLLGEIVRFRPCFCANTRHFYFLVQTQAVSNRLQPPEQYLSKQIDNSFENWF